MPKKKDPVSTGPRNLQHANTNGLHALEAVEFPKSDLVDLPEKLREMGWTRGYLKAQTPQQPVMKPSRIVQALHKHFWNLSPKEGGWGDSTTFITLKRQKSQPWCCVCCCWQGNKHSSSSLKWQSSRGGRRENCWGQRAVRLCYGPDTRGYMSLWEQVELPGTSFTSRQASLCPVHV